MALSIVRFQNNNQGPSWGLLTGEHVQALSLPCTTTGDLLAYSHAELRAAAEASTKVPLATLTLLSPITKNAKVLCQGANYRQHMIDSGMDPDGKLFNMFFTKSSAAIHHPVGQIIRPKHVLLLDYEVELTLVLAKDCYQAVTVKTDSLHEYIAGICIGNDISARDVQIPQMQFHKGKSYRTFCPLGPVLCLLTKDEMHYLNEMQLTLRVNGERRQYDNTNNMVFKPAATLSEMSQIADFARGDVIMTGTPSGCALALPAPAMVRASGLLPDNVRWKLFTKAQLRSPKYLKDGDVVELHIISLDGKLNLGIQKHVISAEV
jgi:2-keto-4-pentenoate hydratase/2-oxohepta-3-ene-1,7-dioic acid hydratase in catechol pathway